MIISPTVGIVTIIPYDYSQQYKILRSIWKFHSDTVKVVQNNGYLPLNVKSEE